ncbi:hypothetical protein Lal_00004158 [Lupinus albus]|uniref:Uncharacterized protein n=1 Tax=Lupinus albus TaxID=3870 RepID=A0A6A4P680_LUPAL|nr:hypothetical protein Lalb_Chr15g0078961 [Lupinus albus]KAF1894234.1 hypothetical protein Lal_00004158 [Lupinus albus]
MKVIALFLVHFLLFSSLCLHHEENFSRETSLSRKLLSLSFASVSTSIGEISGSKKQHKKDVESSFRKVPSSGPNPTQNKYPIQNKT